MKKLLIIYLFIVMPYASYLQNENNGISLGVELNYAGIILQTSGTQPSLKNHFQNRIGFSAYVYDIQRIGKKILLNLKPGLAILNFKENYNDTYSKNFTCFLFDVEIGYLINKSNKINVGIGYTYIDKSSNTLHNPYRNFDFPVNRKHFVNPIISFEHNWNALWSSYIKFTYFTKDAFNTPAEDVNGDLQYPVKAKPYYFSLGFNCINPLSVVRNRLKKKK